MKEVIGIYTAQCNDGTLSATELQKIGKVNSNQDRVYFILNWGKCLDSAAWDSASSVVLDGDGKQLKKVFLNPSVFYVEPTKKGKVPFILSIDSTCIPGCISTRGKKAKPNSRDKKQKSGRLKIFNITLGGMLDIQ